MSSAAPDSTPGSLPPRPPALASHAHKGDAGRVVVLAGSREMPGAALLASRAALRAGAGLVTLGCLDDELLTLAPVATPELLLWDLSAADGFGRLDVTSLERGLAGTGADVVVCGPGLGDTERTALLLSNLLGTWRGPLVLDADALGALAARTEGGRGSSLRRVVRERAERATTVLTPHPGEARRLLEPLAEDQAGERGRRARSYLDGADLGSDPEARAGAAWLLAHEYRALVCLKGARTVVSAGGGTWAEPDVSWTNPSGNPGMATAGSGDVLAGCLAALLVPSSRLPGSERSSAALAAARAAVYLHGLAGDRAARRLGQRGMIASDLIDELGPAEQEGPWGV